MKNELSFAIKEQLKFIKKLLRYDVFFRNIRWINNALKNNEEDI